MLPKLTLVLGGAASGKSVFAERLVESANTPLVYIATAAAHDQEMKTKIARHQARRNETWRTLEAPRNTAAALADVQAHETVLFDCATLWLTNHLIAMSHIADEETRLIKALHDCKAPVVIVSNEVGGGIVPDNAQARAFREAQGKLNQRLAREAGLVVTVMAGLPMVLKGQLPTGLA